MPGFKDIDLHAAVADRVIAGDGDAIGTAYRLMAGAVMGLALRILQDRGLAEEVVQDTFVELVEKGGAIRDGGAIPGWVRRVAVNHCLMRLRSPWHARRDAAEPVVEQSPATERYESVEIIEQAFAQLGPETRAVLWLHDVEGYTHREIGTLMGKTASFSKSQLARGYERLLGLRQTFAGTGGPEPGDPPDGARRPTIDREGYGKSGKGGLDGFGSPCAS